MALLVIINEVPEIFDKAKFSMKSNCINGDYLKEHDVILKMVGFKLRMCMVLLHINPLLASLLLADVMCPKDDCDVLVTASNQKDVL